VIGPRGDAGPAAMASRGFEPKRSETGDCAGGDGPAQAATGVRPLAPADGLKVTAEAKMNASTQAPASAPSIYAALDLGTNNCRLLVAKPSRRGFLVIDAFSRIIRLGEGVLTSGRLSEVAMRRTIDALKVCADKMSRRGVTRSRSIATEACRIAANGAEFIARARAETGLGIEIVTQETEAKLAVSGCASLIDRNADFTLVFDIGGGSSELIWLDLSRLGRPWRRTLHDRVDMQSCIAAWTSLPIGVVNLAERHGGRDVTPENYEAMVADVMAGMGEFESTHRFGERIAGNHAHFLGTSGTVTTISGIHLKLPFYERSRVDGAWLSAGDVRSVSSDLIAMTYAERAAQPCIGHERADLVLAGCAILEALLRVWPCQRLRVADRGLREGILATLMAEDGHDRRSSQQARHHRQGHGMRPHRR
jgi:exopolyphosphatase / guanosine-5'-triphosphate,3'-diphosphate pyrophosphatase